MRRLLPLPLVFGLLFAPLLSASETAYACSCVESTIEQRVQHADVVAIGAEPDGKNINDGYGATKPANLQKAVVEHKADVGIALDGDADRDALDDFDEVAAEAFSRNDREL